MQGMNRLTPLLLAALCGGCFLSRGTINEPLSLEAVESLEVGRSTAEDVLRVLGAPTDVVQLGRESAWRYDFTTTKRAGLLLVVVALLNEDTRSDRVWAFFDAEGVLRNLGTTLEGEEAKYAMPWVDLHD